MLGIIYRHFYANCNTISLFNLYISLVHPCLEYACSVWSPHSSGAVAWIESIQKLGLRIVWWVECNLLAEFQIPTLERRRSELSLCLLYKISKSLFFFQRASLSTKHLQLMLPGHPPVHYWSSHLLSLLPILILIFLVQFNSGTPFQNKSLTPLLLVHLNLNCLTIAYDITILGFT